MAMKRKKADLAHGSWKAFSSGKACVGLAWAGFGFVLIAGCGSGEGKEAAGQVVQHDVFGRPVKEAQSGTQEGDGTKAWSIVLGAFSPDREEDLGQPYQAAAHTALFRAQAMAGLNGVTLEKRGNGLVLLYGSFESATSTEAQQELALVRQMDVGGTHPYESAFLAPPGASTGTMPDYDLATVKARRGTRKPLYTLQIAVYGRTDDKDPTKEDLEQFRLSAEDAVSRLRKEGEQAYYYHGPNRSMVTIGVFSEQDAGFGSRMRGEGPALIIARQKYPNNLLNGDAVRERRGGEGEGRLQPSRLVEVPG